MAASSQERWRLFLGNAKVLRAFIRRRVRDPAETDEVFQELSLVVLRHCSDPKEIEQFTAWCHALTRNVLAHHFRTKRRRANLLSRLELERVAFETRYEVDPERSASARELLVRLKKRLDPRARDLLSLRYLLGESTEEIAMRLERSPTAVRMRLMRLRSIARRTSS
jgi:RNA polymerase sigma factor (sigma-70 family)